MKELNLEFEVKRSCTKIRDLQQQAAQIRGKLERLENQLNQVRAGAQKEIDRITSFGYKTPRRDDKVETQDELQKKDEYNLNLYKQKLELIKKFEPSLYSQLEGMMPTVLRDENLDI